MVAQAQVFVGHAQIEQPIVVKSFQYWNHSRSVSGFAEEFQLHLLKFAGTEGKVSGSDLVTEDLPTSIPKRQLFAGGALNIGKFTKIPCAVSGRR